MTVTAPTERKLSDHTYYSMTKSLCSTCKKAVDAKIIFKGGQVWFDKFCEEHGHQECMVASSVQWYLDALSFVAPNTPPKTVRKEISSRGCPFDCGPCSSHQQKTYLPVIPITSACNLDCPICYTINKNEDPHRLTKEDFQTILDHLANDHSELDIINFTGGEPTLHPELPEFLRMCREAGIERLTISTNGLKLKNEEFVKVMAELDARIVLSLDTFDPETDKILLGANTVKTKLKVLDLLEKHDVSVTILPAVAAGVNDKDVPKLFELVMSRKNILSLELHTLTFTGQGGVGFQRTGRITVPDLQQLVCDASAGRVTPKDFVPSPLAHPHCYSICYLLCLEDGDYIPFTQLTSRATLYGLLQDSLYIEPRAKLEEVFRAIIDDLWVNPDKVEKSEQVLKAIKRLLRDLYPPGKPLDITARRRISERSVKAVYIHSHMDEETFDAAKVMKCCVAVPETDGTSTPTCAYNVIYREQDERFADDGMLKRMDETRPDGPKALPVAQANA